VTGDVPAAAGETSSAAAGTAVSGAAMSPADSAVPSAVFHGVIFIRSDSHEGARVRAGCDVRGCGPADGPGCSWSSRSRHSKTGVNEHGVNDVSTRRGVPQRNAQQPARKPPKVSPATGVGWYYGASRPFP